MKKTLSLVLWLIFLSGCATYKFHYGNKPYDKNYVVARDGNTFLEYTIGKDNSPPSDLELAKERFIRRRKIVEHYYKKMGYMENRFKQNFWNPAVYFLKFMGGVFRLPFIAISDYRYNHNPRYREKIRRLNAERDSREETRVRHLKDTLNTHIQKDLATEQEAQAK